MVELLPASPIVGTPLKKSSRQYRLTHKRVQSLLDNKDIRSFNDNNSIFSTFVLITYREAKSPESPREIKCLWATRNKLSRGKGKQSVYPSVVHKSNPIDLMTGSSSLLI